MILFTAFDCVATHNRAGEITYVQVGPLEIRMTVTTYTKTSSSSVDRDSIEVFWGDGTSEIIYRDNGAGQPLGNDVKLNTYRANHTYPGRATYTIGFLDPNRVGNILNVNYPNSKDVEFFLSTTFTLLDPQFQGTNSSAILLQPPVDIACANKIFKHNPNAYDPDGDSLSYELVVPLMSAMEEVPGYKFPNEITPGPQNNISLDPSTGDFIWDSPKQQGEYNIAIKINEWRNGILLNSIIRDMQILVLVCNNDPPTIAVESEICIVAGEELNLEIEVDDPNDGQLVLLTALGGPFQVDTMKARLENNPGQVEPKFTANFVWQTSCNHISDQYYQVVFRAVDNFFGDTVGLATLRTIKIKVVGPPPENLEAESDLSRIKLFWDKPYACEVTDSSYFQGFSVWRKVGSTNVPLDTCDPGLTGSPYQKIIFLTKAVENGRYTAVDPNVEKGITYCYRVVAEFAKTTSTGNTFNRVESLRSNEDCQLLIRDLPLITKASIETTSKTNGSVHIRWSKPIGTDLDTIMNPPPYRYELYRSIDDGLNFNLIPDFTVTTNTFSESIDTSYFDLGLNTEDIQPHYYIKLFTAGLDYGNSSSVSSTYLLVLPSDKSLILEWSEFVPWSKVGYNVYFQNEMTGIFEYLDETLESAYIHKGLENGKEYCYKIEALGSYNIDNIEDPLINFSQEVCNAPYDNVPPCQVDLIVENVCSEDGVIDAVEDLVNTLTYSKPNMECIETDDVVGYNIYFSEVQGGELILIDSILEESVNTYMHNPERGISGCYAVTAFDENRNESELSNIICVDNCPAYMLPNTFTPNNDGANELFVPIVNRFIDRIDFVAYNEWGNEIFKTQDPMINWDGIASNGKQLAEGTYFYTCRVYEQRVTGVSEASDFLSGYIQILR